MVCRIGEADDILLPYIVLDLGVVIVNSELEHAICQRVENKSPH
jgi:hypothetical protein